MEPKKIPFYTKDSSLVSEFFVKNYSDVLLFATVWIVQMTRSLVRHVKS